jgi:hypothetical protein
MNESSSRSFGRTVLAALVFLVAGWLLLGFIIHIVSFLLSTVVFILAVVAVVWAFRVLL